MKLFSEKSQCCGCMACVDICPRNAVVIKTDAEGFLYPYVRQDHCVNCGRCKDVCPLPRKDAGELPGKYFAAQAKNERLREVSTSGGVFPVLAEAVLEQGGMVYGAGFDNTMRVVHQRAVSRDELEHLKRTKYVQSSTAGIFCRVQQDLKMGKQVLFIGTPCQSYALQRFLQKDYSNLLLVDLICYGVPSPGIWERYTAYLEKKHHGKLTEFQFRDKRGCDNGHTVSYRIGGKEYVEKYSNSPFVSMYFSNHMLRPSCYTCPFTTVKRSSDITIGDFWGNGKITKQMDDGMGTSLVMLRSKRGVELWESIRERFDHIECSLEEAVQPRLISPTPQPSKRRLFLLLYRRLPFGVFAQAKRIRRFLHGRK